MNYKQLFLVLKKEKQLFCLKVCNHPLGYILTKTGAGFDT